MVKMADEKGVTIIGPATVCTLIQFDLSSSALDCEFSAALVFSVINELRSEMTLFNRDT